MTRRASSPLRVIAEALKNSRPHSDGGAIVGVPALKLRQWAAKLEELENRAGAVTEKAVLHTQWALQYWTHRALAPEDVRGAIRAAQQFTTALYPWAPTPNAQTIKRVARRHRAEVLRAFRADSSLDLAPLLTYLKNRERRGRQ